MAEQIDLNVYLQQRPAVMPNHMRWHNNPTMRSGRDFLQFHRDMLTAFDQWLRLTGRPVITEGIPSVEQIRPVDRFRFSGARNILLSSITLRQFPDSNSLGNFIQGIDPNNSSSGIHDVVHSSFPAIADRRTAPSNILFWRWHKWIDNVWIASGLQ